MTTINVPMHVNRVESRGGFVAVWGHVGDYEVCLWMSEDEASAKGLTVQPPARDDFHKSFQSLPGFERVTDKLAVYRDERGWWVVNKDSTHFAGPLKTKDRATKRARQEDLFLAPHKTEALLNDPAIKQLVAAIKSGNREARKVLVDRVTELGFVIPNKGYVGFVVAYLCKNVQGRCE